jgi:type III restriction enzyme
MDREVKDDLNRPAKPEEPLPDLVLTGYYLLGTDWLETKRSWESAGAKTPPVVITVANRTETAARIKNAFDKGKVLIEELCEPGQTLHIDSKVLTEAESKDEPTLSDESLEGEDETEGTRKLTKKDQAELLRLTVDTVGKMGAPGEQIQNVISVGMLSEGWDAKTVTHIMGLRAFSSQLLCEQVVGRGLRRTSYELNPESKLYDPEYVNIFGVPFTFLPHERDTGTPPPPPSFKTAIMPVKEREKEFSIQWPNVVRIDRVLRTRLAFDVSKIDPLRLSASDTAQLVELAPIVDGKPDVSKISEIDLQRLGERFRTQKIIFEAAGNIFELMRPSWTGSRESLLAQVIAHVERFIGSARIEIEPALFYRDDLKRRILLTLNMNKIVQHVFDRIKSDSTEALLPVFDTTKPIRSTSDVLTWYTGKPCEPTKKSHINFCVFDSTWEATEAFHIDRSPKVQAWVKNDHLGFEIVYVFKGVVRKYRPDFLIRLANGTYLILEVKGQDTAEAKAKHNALGEWVSGVNAHGGFATWNWQVSFEPSDVEDKLAKFADS